MLFQPSIPKVLGLSATGPAKADVTWKNMWLRGTGLMAVYGLKFGRRFGTVPADAEGF